MAAIALWSLLYVSIVSSAFELRSWDAASTLAAAAVSTMTQDEKIGMVTGVGMFTSRCVGSTAAINSTNLTIPSLCYQDGPAGLRLVKNVTGFPSGINAASTFSRRLMNARGVAMAEEARAKGVHVFLGPALDIMRNPKAGRNWESFGPDPYLTGEAAYETVMGIQSVGVQACAKHFIGNNQEHWRYGLSADIPDRATHETHFFPYLRTIEANVSAVMCSYNQVNGTSSCHNTESIAMLRAGGFQGYVVSDWGATHDSAEDNADAGLDMEMPGDWILIGGGVYSAGLGTAVNDGDVSAQTFDTMVTNVLTPWYRLGQDSGFPETNFDVQNPDGSGSLNLNVNVRSDAHTALVREIGAASAVLIKNSKNDTSSRFGLPLVMDQINSIAVIGQDAKMLNLDCNALNECNDGTMTIGWGSGSNSVAFTVPPIDAITDFVGSQASITSVLTNDLTDGPAAAEGKDVAIVFANAMSGELGFYDIVDGNMGDRNDLDLWYKGGSLIEAVAAVNNNTIVVIHSVGPVSLSWNEHVNITGVIYAGAPGEQTGPSLVDVLWGAVNPSGRLPFSIDEDEASYGTSIVYNSITGFPVIDYTEGILLDYKYMDSQGITPHFEFGYGLSYTTFGYSSLSISASGTSQVITFVVTNTGNVDGTEIPQLYLGYPSSTGETSKVLRGFDEVPLTVGSSQTVSMTIALREMSTWDTPSQSWVKPSGAFQVYIGASIKDIRLQGSF